MNRRSILKTLLVAPFAPLAKWFPKPKQSDRVRMVEVDIGPEMGFLMQGVVENDAIRRDVVAMDWCRWQPEPKCITGNGKVFLHVHEVRGTGQFKQPLTVFDINMPPTLDGWEQTGVTFHTEPILDENFETRYLVEVRISERCVTTAEKPPLPDKMPYFENGRWIKRGKTDLPFA